MSIKLVMPCNHLCIGLAKISFRFSCNIIWENWMNSLANPIHTYVCMYVCMCNYLCICLSVNVCVCIRRIGHDWAHMHLSIYWQISLSISHFSFDMHPLILPLTCLPDSLVAKPDVWILTSSIWSYLFLRCIEVHNLAEDSLPKSHGVYLSPFTSSATRAGSS